MSATVKENEGSAAEPGASAAAADDHEIGLLDLALVLAKYKKIVIGVPLLAGILAVIYSLLLPNIYTATAKILPPQQNQSSFSAMLGQLGALAGMAGGAAGLKSSNDLYIGMLNSRTVADGLIERFELQRRYDSKTLDGTRLALAGNTVISSGKDTIIKIQVDDKDPKLAAEIANAYVDELYNLTQGLAVTESSQRRLFFENQLKGAKEDLAKAEGALKQTQQRTGLIQLNEQGRAIIENVARMRAQVAAKEVQLTAMRTFATGSNPDYVLAQQELVELRGQLGRLERDQGGEQGNIFVPTGKIAEAGLEYVRRVRDVKYHETIYELLAKQFEIAKIDEAKDSSVVQVLDKAVVPERKSKPKRAMIVLSVTFVAAFVAFLVAFSRQALENARRNPEQSRRLYLLREYLRMR